MDEVYISRRWCDDIRALWHREIHCLMLASEFFEILFVMEIRGDAGRSNRPHERVRYIFIDRIVYELFLGCIEFLKVATGVEKRSRVCEGISRRGCGNLGTCPLSRYDITFVLVPKTGEYIGVLL